MKLQISEIFYSIQGEGLLVGKPCVFIRLSGCNLQCKWCDTKFAWDTAVATELSISSILQKIENFNCKLVLVTGGEPLLQPATIELLKQLIRNDYNVLLETNGSISIHDVPQPVNIALDMKCPGSNMESRNNYANIKLLKQTDTVKFIVATLTDCNWALNKIVEQHIYDFCNNIIFSPVHPQMQYSELATWLLTIKQHCVIDDDVYWSLIAAVRMQVQLHKIVWEPNERGR